MEELQASVKNAYTIEQCSEENVAAQRAYKFSSPYVHKAVRIYEAADTGLDSESPELPEGFAGYLGTEADGFTIYEFENEFPGFVSFSAD
jgi:hypothetical protein